MDYTKLSDQQINMLVAKIEHPDRKIIESMSRPPSVLMPGGINTLFDYCNNPTDAWPIIKENGICIGYDGMSWDASCHLHEIGPVSDWKQYPESPLRMAMIVFLLIQDANHANS